MLELKIKGYICNHADSNQCVHSNDCPHGQPHFMFSVCPNKKSKIINEFIHCCKSDLSGTTCLQIWSFHKVNDKPQFKWIKNQVEV